MAEEIKLQNPFFRSGEEERIIERELGNELSSAEINDLQKEDWLLVREEPSIIFLNNEGTISPVSGIRYIFRRL